METVPARSAPVSLTDSEIINRLRGVERELTDIGLGSSSALVQDALAPIAWLTEAVADIFEARAARDGQS